MLSASPSSCESTPPSDEHQEMAHFSHYFCDLSQFDWVFSKDTLRALAQVRSRHIQLASQRHSFSNVLLVQVLERSPFYVLVSFRKPNEWWNYGLAKIQPVCKLPGFRTSGNVRRAQNSIQHVPWCEESPSFRLVDRAYQLPSSGIHDSLCLHQPRKISDCVNPTCLSKLKATIRNGDVVNVLCTGTRDSTPRRFDQNAKII